jgi:MoaA/NifB/PqqE/SkfB family radical SAM enzyme
MSKLPIRNLEFHVTNACNLRCDNCSHYSNYGLAGHVSLGDAERQFALWTPRIVPHFFSLLGGEPTLHPKLVELVELAAIYWKDSILQLVTNGWFLSRHPRLPDVLDRHRVRLEISIHHDDAAYRDKIASIRELVSTWQACHRFRVHWRESYSTWRMVYRGHGTEMQPCADDDPASSWKHCPCKWCPQLVDGRIYKCPPVAYLPILNRKLSLSQAWQPYLAYKPLEIESSDSDLREFLKAEVETVCGMCPARPRPLSLASPIPGLSE